MGTHPASSKWGGPPIFGLQLLSHTAAWVKTPIGTEVGLGLRDVVLDGDPALPPLNGHSPQFSANVSCGQTAGCTKMPQGMEVGLGPGDFVFDGDPANPRNEGTSTPTQCLTHVYCGQTARWIKMPLLRR